MSAEDCIIAHLARRLGQLVSSSELAVFQVDLGRGRDDRLRLISHQRADDPPPNVRSRAVELFRTYVNMCIDKHVSGYFSLGAGNIWCLVTLLVDADAAICAAAYLVAAPSKEEMLAKFDMISGVTVR